uniref:Molecular chaperone DnaJ n=1 Tax=uncultured Alphaproteobacteria bacterium TaxID=91750 RepID=A0A6M4NN85_9PROT|nr:molecular chaperone DnaJ [uncultured Alphaproteobacteria bacterium]
MPKFAKSKKYYAPQCGDKECKCDFPGCDKAGEYRAPKDRSLKEYYWFCLEHVQAYNAGWNYYDEEPEEEPELEKKPKMHFKGYRSKVNYQFGYKIKDDFGFFGEYADSFESRKDMFYTEQEKDFLKIMELSGSEISIPLLKKQYKKLVKKYHPDINRDDKNAEEKFKQLTNAYQALLKKFS